MKKIGCFLFVISLLTSCDKDALNALLPQMSATVDGVEWTSLPIAVEKDGQFIITGTAKTGESLIISIFGNTEGTYNLEIPQTTKFTASYKETTDQHASDAYIAISGTVNLLEVNTGTKTISGNFNFKMQKGLDSTIDITNGEFSRVNYTVQ